MVTSVPVRPSGRVSIAMTARYLAALRPFPAAVDDRGYWLIVGMPSLSYAESVVIARSPEALYDMVSDVTRMGEWSPVCRGAIYRPPSRSRRAWV